MYRFRLAARQSQTKYGVISKAMFGCDVFIDRHMSPPIKPSRIIKFASPKSIQCCPKNTQDQIALNANCTYQSLSNLLSSDWLDLKPARAIMQYKTDQTIGNAMFGGVHGALLSC